MPFTVPGNPAPYPFNIGGTGQTYGGTDWGRLSGNWRPLPAGGSPLGTYNPGLVNTPVSSMGPWAQAPGYTQVMPRSTYQDWWRGAGFGQMGRMPAIGQGGGGVWGGIGVEEPYTPIDPTNPYTNPTVNPAPLPPRGTTGIGTMPPVIPNPKEIYKPVDDWPPKGTTRPGTGWGL